ncbi:MAG: lipoyl(octanoyl) transferase LipB [Clostridia bacterium]|nr:lipoyl(octanoyl) transferase LipB [Clostridia bacterium]
MNNKRLNVINLHNADYKEVWDIQHSLRDQRIQHQIDDCLLLVTHPHVLTFGKRGKYENLLVSKEVLEQKGISVFEIERGGDITYHGPGQLVIYPIIDLKNHDRDLRGFVENLQNAVVKLLKDHFDICAHNEDGIHTGVWVGNDKIAAIGLSLSKWVTMHGMAFNINTDLSYFDFIVPCGLTDRGVTSISKLKGSPADFDFVTELFIQYFSNLLGCIPFNTDLENLNGTKT